VTQSINSDQIARKIRAARRGLGWSREQLAERCHAKGYPRLTHAALVNIETGRRRADGSRRREITVDELCAIADVFGCALARLLEPPTDCRVCHGTPPLGFACTECGTTTKETDT
jgi:transcriptional regulator with XRE-family HTH domain